MVEGSAVQRENKKGRIKVLVAFHSSGSRLGENEEVRKGRVGYSSLRGLLVLHFKEEFLVGMWPHGKHRLVNKGLDHRNEGDRLRQDPWSVRSLLMNKVLLGEIRKKWGRTWGGP